MWGSMGREKGGNGRNSGLSESELQNMKLMRDEDKKAGRVVYVHLRSLDFIQLINHQKILSREVMGLLSSGF